MQKSYGQLLADDRLFSRLDFGDGSTVTGSNTTQAYSTTRNFTDGSECEA